MDIKARELWEQWGLVYNNGHSEYVETAKRNERFYLGGGSQWANTDRCALEGTGRKAVEFNRILPVVQTITGHQINNRMDVSFFPRGEADQKVAEVLTKLARHVLDTNKYPWVETQAFTDGLVMQRGYIDIRMDFEKNATGDIVIANHDPLDVIPDPHANSYDPDDWQFVLINKWMTLDEIEALYGKDKRSAVEVSNDGDNVVGAPKGNTFGKDSNFGYAWIQQGETNRRYRVIERQRFVRQRVKCVVMPGGEIYTLGNDELNNPERMMNYQKLGAQITDIVKNVVEWRIATNSIVLHDDLSPYSHFTVVPYFPIFRRGITRGVVDNLISPQEVENKAVSQLLHIINTVANSGWMVEENSLTNMDTDDLGEHGAKTGLVIEYKRGHNPPQKIQPNQYPNNLDRIAQMAANEIKEISGVSDSLQGQHSPEVSGVAIQSKQYMGLQQQASFMDALERTRNLVAVRMLDLFQRYYDSHRVFRISESDINGNKTSNIYEINAPTLNETGEIQYINDLTIGDYDVVISTQPTQATFENNQFTQALELMKAGIAIPPHVLVKHSNLTDKQEIISTMTQNKPDPMKEAEVALMGAQAKKIQADTTNKKVETLYSATQAANLVAMNAQVAPVADQMLRSAGFDDSDGGQIVEQPQGVSGLNLPTNTNPTTPLNPAVGMSAGIEAGN